MLFPQLYGKCQGKTRKDGTRPALFHISCYLCCVGCYLCCSGYCLCVNVYCHRVTTQLQLINISYHKLDGTATRTNTRRCCCLQIRQELLYWKLDRANLDSACLPLFFTAIIFIYYIYLFILLWRCDPTRVMASLFLRFLDHTQRRTTFGRTPLDE